MLAALIQQGLFSHFSLPYVGEQNSRGSGLTVAPTSGVALLFCTLYHFAPGDTG